MHFVNPVSVRHLSQFLKKRGAGSPKLSLVIIIAVITHSFFCYFVIYSSDGNREREKEKETRASVSLSTPEQRDTPRAVAPSSGRDVEENV